MSVLDGKRILVVEDFVIIALDIEQMLQELGCTVIGPAARVEEAANLAAVEDLDGALLDVNLNGCAVDPVAEILAARGIPFIFVTGYDTPYISESFRSRPVIVKPFAVDELSSLMISVFSPLRAAVGCG